MRWHTKGLAMDYPTLSNLLAKLAGCSFAALDTETIPVLKGGKSNPMQGKVLKRVTGSRIMLFTNTNSSGYENKVRRHLELEGKNPDSFKLGALPWGERVKDSPFITNRGEYYLQAVFLKPGQVDYLAITDMTFAENIKGKWHYSCGEYIDKANIPGLPDTTGSEHQGLENEVIVRAYKLDSIVAIRAFGEELKQ